MVSNLEKRGASMTGDPQEIPRRLRVRAPARHGAEQGPYEAGHLASCRPPRPVRCQASDLTCKRGTNSRRFALTAIDPATGSRVLKICDGYTGANAVAFVDRAIGTLPLGICAVRTDNGHAFQARLHRHVEDSGIRYTCIGPAPRSLTVGSRDRTAPTRMRSTSFSATRAR